MILIKIVDRGAKSIWDCICKPGYYGFGGACMECPDEVFLKDENNINNH